MFPGAAFAAATRSATVFTDELAGTTSSKAEDANIATGTRSFCVSYLSWL